MIRRPATEARPMRPPYATVELPVPRDPPGAWTFRVPRWSQLAPISHALAESGSDGASLDAAFGRLVGLAWADEEYALEADPADGEAVFSELYEAGWSVSTIYALGNRLQEIASAEIPREKEVREKLRFFGANGAALGSQGSSLPGSTAGTSAHTT